MQPKYVIGLDYGTNSVRTLVVRVQDGFESGTHVFEYPHGDAGILLDSSDPNLARQHPADYLQGAEVSVRGALEDAQRNDPDFAPERVIGIGVDTTGSTPLPVDENGVPLAFHERFQNNLNAMAWLWKDHTSTEEAVTITETAAKMRPQYLAKCGNSYSSEWFWAKIWHCLNTDPDVFNAAYTWVECADWIPSVLTGNDHPSRLLRGVCAAGHKALYNPQWGGLPDKEFLSALNPRLAELRDRLYEVAYTSDHPAGRLTAEWAAKLGLPEGIPVAVGAFDAHLGGVGAGIKPGTLVKIIGTSCCDMMVVPNTEPLADIPGTTGIV
ncbi:MAG: FGGY family carbohydrate kinase, partial [bacterium]|nr:FGGY family carbohydrate kinase [bacterium]